MLDINRTAYRYEPVQREDDMDICTRKFFGWAMNRQMREKLILDAANETFARENPRLGLMNTYRQRNAIYEQSV